MRLRHLGYVGQNLTLGLTTNRTLRLANLPTGKLELAIAANLEALAAILEWNVRNDIRLFRIGSSVIPFASHEAFSLDWRERFAPQLARLREFMQEEGIRLSMHPGQYTVLNSPSPHVVANARAELLYSAQLLEELTPGAGTIILHLGGAYGDRGGALERFTAQAGELEPLVLGKLCLENDDTSFDAEDALSAASQLRLPVVFDFHHHRVLNRTEDGPEPPAELLERVAATWGGRTPKFHLSSPREPGAAAHSDYIDERDLFAALDSLAGVRGDAPFDLMIEAKAKDKAVLAVKGTLAAASVPHSGAPDQRSP